MPQTPIAVMGGGPAGMMAAIVAAQGDRPVLLFEKNEKLGKKLYLTGKGRCNLTNACPAADLTEKIPQNPRFLLSAFHQFDNKALMDYMESLGVPLRVEQGMRVFPVSQKSSDIIRALERGLNQMNVQVHLNTALRRVHIREGRVEAVEDSEGAVHPCAALVVAAGGVSYPATGSTGDGYELARSAGHRVEPPEPALVPVSLSDPWAPGLQGLSLVHVALVIRDGKKTLLDEVGEMMFTHFGVTGPLVLKATGLFPQQVMKGARTSIDLKPGLGTEQLDARLLRDFSGRPQAQLDTALRQLLPRRIIDPVLGIAGIGPGTTCARLTREERLRLGAAIKSLPVSVHGYRGFEEAVITRGGVSCREVDPRTMQSKVTEGLFFAGEILDTHALTGGFNLQIAFSTGYCAGNYLKTL